jgi:hypothetical protein
MQRYERPCVDVSETYAAGCLEQDLTEGEMNLGHEYEQERKHEKKAINKTCSAAAVSAH